MPNNKSQAEMQSLADRIRQLSRRAEFTHARIASGVRASSATISNLINNKHELWPVATSKIWDNIHGYLKTIGVPMRQKPLSRFIDLPITTELTGLLQACHTQSDFGLIYGLAGGGKTYAAKHYMNSNINVFYYSATPARSTVYSFLCGLARATGAKQSGSAANVEHSIFESLSVQAPRLLIIDEAHHLPQPVIDQIRCLYDNLSGGSNAFGVVLIGNWKILTSIRQRDAAAQIISRFGWQKRITEAGADNVLEVVKASSPDAAADDKFLQLANQIADGDGALRRLVKILRDAIILAAEAKRPLACDSLEQALALRVVEAA